MRKKYFMCNCKIPMRLQIFADDPEGDSGAGGDGAGAGGNGGGAEGEGSQNQTFDDFLRRDGNQAEFDRRVQKAVNTALNKAQEKWKALTDDKLSEAEKLAKMTKEEKAEYMANKREKELADREVAMTRKELMAEAKNTLAEKKLPVGLAEVLVYTDAEACNKSIATVEKEFRAAVEAAVEDRLKGGKPPKRPPQDDDITEEEKIMKIMQGII